MCLEGWHRDCKANSPMGTEPFTPWAAQQLQPLLLQLPSLSNTSLLGSPPSLQALGAQQGCQRCSPCSILPRSLWDDGAGSEPSALPRGLLSHGPAPARLQGTEQLPEPKLPHSQAQDGLSSMEICELGVAGTILTNPRATRARGHCEMGYRTPEMFFVHPNWSHLYKTSIESA